MLKAFPSGSSQRRLCEAGQHGIQMPREQEGHITPYLIKNAATPRRGRLHGPRPRAQTVSIAVQHVIMVLLLEGLEGLASRL